MCKYMPISEYLLNAYLTIFWCIIACLFMHFLNHELTSPDHNQRWKPKLINETYSLLFF